MCACLIFTETPLLSTVQCQSVRVSESVSTATTTASLVSSICTTRIPFNPSNFCLSPAFNAQLHTPYQIRASTFYLLPSPQLTPIASAASEARRFPPFALRNRRSSLILNPPWSYSYTLCLQVRYFTQQPCLLAAFQVPAHQNGGIASFRRVKKI